MYIRLPCHVFKITGNWKYRVANKFNVFEITNTVYKVFWSWIKKSHIPIYIFCGYFVYMYAIIPLWGTYLYGDSINHFFSTTLALHIHDYWLVDVSPGNRQHRKHIRHKIFPRKAFAETSGFLIFRVRCLVILPDDANERSCIPKSEYHIRDIMQSASGTHHILYIICENKAGLFLIDINILEDMLYLYTFYQIIRFG